MGRFGGGVSVHGEEGGEVTVSVGGGRGGVGVGKSGRGGWGGEQT